MALKCQVTSLLSELQQPSSILLSAISYQVGENLPKQVNNTELELLVCMGDKAEQPYHLPAR